MKSISPDKTTTANTDYHNAELEFVGWPFPFGTAQPEGTVLSNGPNTFFIYPGRESDAWVVLEFIYPRSVKYGIPNISELDSHPLCGRAKPGDLYIVHKSPWQAEARAMNAGHSQYDDAHWRKVHHYFAFLWDYTFECLATGFVSKELRAPFGQVLERVVARIHAVR